MDVIHSRVLKCTYRFNQSGVMKPSSIVATLTDYLFSLVSFQLMFYYWKHEQLFLSRPGGIGIVHKSLDH
jgi:hypothetical protein